jgi:RNA polymerase sigma-70 factor (ECF subfamily)
MKFDQFLSAYSNNILSFIKYRFGEQNCQDIFQRAAIIMWNKFNEFKIDSDFCAWAKTIAFNEGRNYYRKISRNPVLFDQQIFDDRSENLIFEQQEQKQLPKKLIQIIDSLDEQAKIIINGIMDGLEIREIAKLNNKAPQTFYNKFNKVKKQIHSLCESIN